MKMADVVAGLKEGQHFRKYGTEGHELRWPVKVRCTLIPAPNSVADVLYSVRDIYPDGTSHSISGEVSFEELLDKEEWEPAGWTRLTRPIQYLDALLPSADRILISGLCLEDIRRIEKKALAARQAELDKNF